MLETVQLRLHSFNPGRILLAEDIHADSGTEIDIVLAVFIREDRSLTIDNLHWIPGVGVRNVLRVKRLNVSRHQSSVLSSFLSAGFFSAFFFFTIIVPAPVSVKSSIRTE